MEKGENRGSHLPRLLGMHCSACRRRRGVDSHDIPPCDLAYRLLALGYSNPGILQSRADRIRTCDLFVPNEARYQPALQLDVAEPRQILHIFPPMTSLKCKKSEP